MTINQLKIGDKLPHFILNDENHRPVDVAALTGKFLVLYFYPKDHSPVCVREASGFRDSFQELMNVGAMVFGVSNDKPDSHYHFKQKNNLPFSLLSDTAGELRKMLGVPFDLFGLLPGRVTYIFNPEGQLCRIFKSQLSPRKHVKEALNVIRNRQT